MECQFKFSLQYHPFLFQFLLNDLPHKVIGIENRLWIESTLLLNGDPWYSHINPT